MTISAVLARARALFETGQFLPIFVLIVAIQGTVLISQSLAALFLSPEEIGKIRLFESVASIGILLAGFGAPALAIREMAAHQDAADRGRILRDLVLLPIVGAALLGLFALASTLFAVDWLRAGKDVLATTIVLLVVTNFVRLGSAVSQGVQIVHQVYGWVIAGSALAIVIQVTGAAIGGLSSWVTGRLIAELVLLACLLIGMGANMPVIVWQHRLQMRALHVTVGSATLINAGLLLRMIADATPILLLGGLLPQFILPGSAIDLGYFGIATLFLTVAQLVPAVLSQRALPRIAASHLAERAALTARFRFVMLLAAIVVSLLGFALAYTFLMIVDVQLPSALFSAATIMASLPLKAMATAYCVTLLVKGDIKSPIWITLIETLIIVITMKFVGSQQSLETASLAMFLGAIFSSLCTYAKARRIN